MINQLTSETVPIVLKEDDLIAVKNSVLGNSWKETYYSNSNLDKMYIKLTLLQSIVYVSEKNKYLYYQQDVLLYHV